MIKEYVAKKNRTTVMVLSHAERCNPRVYCKPNPWNLGILIAGSVCASEEMKDVTVRWW